MFVSGLLGLFKQTNLSIVSAVSSNSFSTLNRRIIETGLASLNLNSSKTNALLQQPNIGSVQSRFNWGYKGRMMLKDIKRRELLKKYAPVRIRLQALRANTVLPKIIKVRGSFLVFLFFLLLLELSSKMRVSSSFFVAEEIRWGTTAQVRVRLVVDLHDESMRVHVESRRLLAPMALVASCVARSSRLQSVVGRDARHLGHSHAQRRSFHVLGRATQLVQLRRLSGHRRGQQRRSDSQDAIQTKLIL